MNEAITPTTPTPTSRATPTAATAIPGGSDPQRLLRAALLVDALVTGANGLAYLAATGRLAGVLGYPDGLLRGVGGFLLGYAVVIAVVSRARQILAVGAWFAIVMNIVWTIVSVACTAGVLTALSGVSAWGRVWTVVQALVVLAFAVAQLVGWRRSQARRG